VDKRLSIDPGLGGTGWATWDDSNWGGWVDNVGPEACGDWQVMGSVNRSKDWLERAYILSDKFEQWLWNNFIADRSSDRIVRCYIEFPIFYDDAGGHMCAKKGNLGKLYCLIGMLVAVCRRWSIPVELIKVPDWKGQLPKPVVFERMERLLGPEVCAKFPKSTHAWDAIGIGLYAKGVRI